MVSSPWAEIASWLALPLLAWLMSVGWALAIERAARLQLPDALLVPLGFTTTMALALLGHSIDLPWWLVVAVLLVVPAAALLVLRPMPRRLLAGWAGIAALATFLLYLAPTLFAGRWTWAGYNLLNDTAYQFLLADWIRSGAGLPAAGLSTTADGLRSYVLTDYPLGSHAQLAALTAPRRIGVEVGYQAYIAPAAAVGAMAAWYLARAASVRPFAAAVCATVALGANLTLHYALQGSIKEIAFVSTLLVMAAMARFLLESPNVIGAAVLVGVAAAGALAAYSAAALPYLGVLAIVAAAGLVLGRELPVRRPWIPVAAGAAAAVLLALPSLPAVVGFARTVVGVYVDPTAGGGGSPLGQLQSPLPLWHLAGVWLNGQYIFPLSGRGASVTHVIATVMFVVAAVGLVYAVVRRRWSILLLALPPLVALAAVCSSVTPYVDAKMFAIAAPAVVGTAAIAVALLARRSLPLGLLLALPLAAAVAGSDAMALHDVRLAPTDRMADIQDVGEHYRGRGLMLFNEFDELAKYFARDARIDQPTDSTAPIFVELRHREDWGGRSYDLDQETSDFVQRFPYLILRRKPSASRPPSNYRLDYINRSYEVWRKTDAPTPALHVPLGDIRHRYGESPYAAAVPSCAAVRRVARGADAGAQLVAAVPPERHILELPNDMRTSRGWVPDPLNPGMLAMHTPGEAVGRLDVRGGSYELWVRASLGRPVDVLVDGRRVGSAVGINTPGGWLRGGRVELGHGRHMIEIRRRGGRPKVGDGAPSIVGAVAVQATDRGRLITVSPDRATHLCGRNLDWIEVVTPDA